MGNARVIGIILIVVGVAVAVLAAAFLFSGVSSGNLTSSGAILGFFIAFLALVAPLVGGGIYIFTKGRGEAARQASAQQQRRLLDMVLTRGQLAVSDAALEMQVSADDVKAMVYQLVGMRVFSGYINWDKGMLYSQQASQLRELDKCKNCGGEIELSGKGVFTCRFCGTEYFLS